MTRAQHEASGAGRRAAAGAPPSGESGGCPGARAGDRLDLLFIAGNARSLIANRGALIRHLLARGQRVGALVPAADYLPEVETLGIPIWQFDMRRTGVSPLHDARTAAELFRHLRALRPRAVFCYTVKPIVYGGPAARLAGVPAVYSMVTGLGHAFTTESLRARAIRAVVTRLYRAGMAASTRVFFQNPDDERELLDRGILRDPAKVVRVNGSGVELDRYPRRAVPRGRPVFLFVGRLLTEKGIAEFCEAARIVADEAPEARFVAVGPHDPALPHAVSAEALARWRRTGPVELVGGVADVRPWLEQCTVLVLPSYREGTPRSVLEAMSVGRAVITCDAPGCRETVVDGVNGFLVPPRQVAPLASAMRRFLADPELAVGMGAESRRIAESKYDVELVNSVITEAMGLS